MLSTHRVHTRNVPAKLLEDEFTSDWHHCQNEAVGGHGNS